MTGSGSAGLGVIIFAVAMLAGVSPAGAQSAESEPPPARGTFKVEAMPPPAKPFLVPDLPPSAADRAAVRSDWFTLKFGLVTLVDYAGFSQDAASIDQVGTQESRWDARSLLRLMLRGTVGNAYTIKYLVAGEYKGFESDPDKVWNITGVSKTFTLGGPATIGVGVAAEHGHDAEKAELDVEDASEREPRVVLPGLAVRPGLVARAPEAAGEPEPERPVARPPDGAHEAQVALRGLRQGCEVGLGDRSKVDVGPGLGGRPSAASSRVNFLNIIRPPPRRCRSLWSSRHAAGPSARRARRPVRPTRGGLAWRRRLGVRSCQRRAEAVGCARAYPLTANIRSELITSRAYARHAWMSSLVRWSYC